MRALIFVAGLLSACSYTFDDSKTEIPQIGTPVDLVGLPHYNVLPATEAAVVVGVDDKLWVAVKEFGNTLRLSLLDDPTVQEVYSSDTTVITYRAIFIEKATLSATGEIEVTVHQPGDSGPGVVFDFFDTGGLFILPASNSAAFAFVHGDTTEQDVRALDKYVLARSDGSFTRTLPVNFSPMANVGADIPFFSDDGEVLFDLEKAYTESPNNIVARHTHDTNDVSLNADYSYVSKLETDQMRQRLLICDFKTGLFAASWIDGSHTVYDSDPGCTDVSIQNDFAYYSINDELRFVPLDGSALPTVVPDFAERQAVRVLIFGPKNEVIYSKDSRRKYVNGVGDGWLGDWRFMERGGAVSFSNDDTRLRWLEHAAKPNGVGDLTSALIPGGSPLTLALNVSQYQELDDGRVLAVADHATAGIQNRIIAIDEQAKVAYYIAEGATGYQNIPNSNDILVDVVTGATGRDVVRLKIPPKPAAPADLGTR